MKTKPIPPHQNRKFLERLYLKENLTQEEIAREFGVSTATVQRWIAKFGLSEKPSSSRKIQVTFMLPFAQVEALDRFAAALVKRSKKAGLGEARSSRSQAATVALGFGLKAVGFPVKAQKRKEGKQWL